MLVFILWSWLAPAMAAQAPDPMALVQRGAPATNKPWTSMDYERARFVLEELPFDQLPRLDHPHLQRWASHDLRQPMHALGMFMELLTGKQHDPETQKLVGRVGQSVSAMGALLDALLDISRLDAGKVVPALTAINASDLILRIASDFEGECDKRGLARPTERVRT